MHQPRLDQWREIENISQQMRDLAVLNQSLTNFSVDQELAEKSWHEISCLDVKRTELLQRFFSISANADESEFLTQGIKFVLELDQELADISRLLQENISHTFSKMGHQQRAAFAYGNVQTA